LSAETQVFGASSSGRRWYGMTESLSELVHIIDARGGRTFTRTVSAV
jgi:hypothetical protein